MGAIASAGGFGVASGLRSMYSEGMEKMIGRKLRACDSRHCTCNAHLRHKGAKRNAKRSERQQWKREV